MQADAAVRTQVGTENDDFLGLERLLDEFDARDFRQAERIVDVFRRQDRSLAGYPRVRPVDCRGVTNALRRLFVAHGTYFRYRDMRIVDRFWAIADTFKDSAINEYPNERLNLDVLLAEVHLACGQPDKAHALIGAFAARPYLIEGDAEAYWKICMFDAIACAQLGRPQALHLPQQLRLLTRLRPWMAVHLFNNFTPYLGMMGRRTSSDGRLKTALQRLANRSLALRRERGNKVWNFFLRGNRRLLDVVGGALTLVEAYSGNGGAPAGRETTAMPAAMKPVVPFPAYPGYEPPSSWRRPLRGREPIVTRAMGGIGDLLMMTPGLRALALYRGHPIKFATKKQFHPLFENNPYVELLDIDGPPIEIERYRWINLSNCPAAFHESLRRPFVKRGRVELFARGMGIRRRRLEKSGQKIDICLSSEQETFRDAWIAERGLGKTRRIVGIQPHSREPYRDHPHMYAIIAELSKRYDVVVFHHVALDLRDAPGAVSTAGLKLGQSLSLVSALDAMVCVDSAFLHAAGAFDTPTVTLFGPIDGPLRTVHMTNTTVLDAREHFGCLPCWRNEDQPCLVTGQIGYSPCMAAIEVQRVLDAVAEKVAAGRPGNTTSAADQKRRDVPDLIINKDTAPNG